MRFPIDVNVERQSGSVDCAKRIQLSLVVPSIIVRDARNHKDIRNKDDERDLRLFDKFEVCSFHRGRTCEYFLKNGEDCEVIVQRSFVLTVGLEKRQRVTCLMFYNRAVGYVDLKFR